MPGIGCGCGVYFGVGPFSSIGAFVVEEVTSAAVEVAAVA